MRVREGESLAQDHTAARPTAETESEAGYTPQPLLSVQPSGSG